MSIDTTKSFEEQIAAATSAEEIHQICLNREVEQGTLTQDRDGTVHPVVAPAAARPSAPAAPAVREDHLREKVVYPSGNVRVVITGVTDEEIVEAEKRIRAAYGQSA
jgi:hypothetical protein